MRATKTIGSFLKIMASTTSFRFLLQRSALFILCYNMRELLELLIIGPALLNGHDPIVTRRRCTISLSLMVLLDIFIPFIPLLGLYIVRRRPIWFKNVVDRLYADQLDENEVIEDFVKSFDSNSISNVVLENKYIALQKSNIEFVPKISAKAG